jgi:hypothetical protein
MRQNSHCIQLTLSVYRRDLFRGSSSSSSSSSSTITCSSSSSSPSSSSLSDGRSGSGTTRCDTVSALPPPPQVGIIPLGRILIIEANLEQIRTNTFFVLQLQNVRQSVVYGRAFPVVGKPFTTVLIPLSILEWSDTSVDENLADRVLCFLKLQLLHVGLLIEKDPL